MGISAYKKTIKKTADPKEIEYRVFQRITNDLKAFVGVKGIENLTEKMKDALWENQKFWNALRADLIVPENSLPPALRAQLLSIASFIDNHTVKILRGKDSVDPIVEVNETIMRGLRPNIQS